MRPVAHVFAVKSTEPHFRSSRSCPVFLPSYTSPHSPLPHFSYILLLIPHFFYFLILALFLQFSYVLSHSPSSSYPHPFPPPYFSYSYLSSASSPRFPSLAFERSFSMRSTLYRAINHFRIHIIFRSAPERDIMSSTSLWNFISHSTSFESTEREWSLPSGKTEIPQLNKEQPGFVQLERESLPTRAKVAGRWTPVGRVERLK